MSDPNPQEILDELGQRISSAKTPQERDDLIAQQNQFVDYLSRTPGVNPASPATTIPYDAGGAEASAAGVSPPISAPYTPPDATNKPRYDANTATASPSRPSDTIQTSPTPTATFGQSDVPDLSLEEYARMSQTRVNPGVGNGRAVKQAGNDVITSHNQTADAVAAQQSTLQSMRTEAESRQLDMEKRMNDTAAQMEADRKQAAATQAEEQQRIQDNTAKHDAVIKEYEVEAKKPTATLLDGGILSALMLGLGAFASTVSGGKNGAMEVLQARVDDSVRQRGERLGALRTKMDAIDQAGHALYKEFGSRKAAEAGMAELTYKAAQAKLEYLAKMDHSGDKAHNAQMMSDSINTLMAQQNEAAANARFLQTQKMGAGSKSTYADVFNKWVETRQKSATLGKTLAEASKNGDVEAAFAKLPPTTRTKIDSSVQAISQLDATIEQVKDLKKAGKTTMPGHENMLNGTPDFMANNWRKALGPKDSNGLPDNVSSLDARLSDLGSSIHRAETGDSANREGEQRVAKQRIMGNMRVDTVLTNLERERANMQKTQDNLFAGTAPAVVAEWRANVERNNKKSAPAWTPSANATKVTR